MDNFNNLAIKYAVKEMSEILMMLFPYKNSNEISILSKVWGKQFISTCLNVATAEKIQDVKLLMRTAINKIFEEVSIIQDPKFVNFSLISKIIKKVATGNRSEILQLEAESAYLAIESRLLHYTDSYTYLLDGVLGATLERLGGMRNIQARVVIGGINNKFNAFAIDRFKGEFIKMYKRVKKGVQRGEIKPIVKIKGAYGENGIVKRIKIQKSESLTLDSGKEIDKLLMEEK